MLEHHLYHRDVPVHSTFLLFLSRLLTKSGDNAWVFAVPMALVHIYPDSLRPVSLFYLLLRILVMLIMPKTGAWIDSKSRPKAIQATILPQLPLMVALAFCLAWLGSEVHPGSGLQEPQEIAIFALLVILSAISQAASHLSSVLVVSDFIPNLFQNERLTKANTTLRRIDLLTEIVSPIATGFVLAFLPWSPFVFSGFVLVAFWNVLSFWLEYLVLRSFLRSGVLSEERVSRRYSTHPKPIEKRSFLQDLKLFVAQPAFFTMLGLSMMHIQVLSPPNVVGSSFLKSGWHISEEVIGLFRGLGAVVSIVATAFVGGIIRRRGLAKSISLFSALQAGFLFLTAISFHWGPDAVWFYLGGIILSRFGHSGFILCEMQIRQETIPQEHLGLMNGIAVSMNAIGSFIILLLGAIYSDPQDFGALVWPSSVAVTICWALTAYWNSRGSGQNLDQFRNLPGQTSESLRRVA